jgi:uncharacterized repeat protein (TIGR01451 family)
MKTVTSVLVLTCLPVALALAAADIEVQKSVSNAYPLADEPVQFTVTVSNIGDEIAADVVVIDQLPGAMGIPAGTAAFPGVGDYDVESGTWTIGSLDPGAEAVLVVPAAVTAEAPPDCIVNTATSRFEDSLDDSNDEARAVVYQNGVEHCVDLGVTYGISAGPLTSSCDQAGTFTGEVYVTNYGPDSARSVIVTLQLDPPVAPNVRFEDSDCSNSPGTLCHISEIAAGETLTIDVTSDAYKSYETFEQEVLVTVTNTDGDFDTLNDNRAAAGTGGGFSSCVEIDYGIPIGGIAPGCFIATAAYGSPLDARLDVLRGFRDRHMLTNALGRVMVAFYYRHSPAIADFIADRDWLRALVRGLLAPVVLAIQYPAWSALWFFGVLAIALVARSARRLAMHLLAD